MPSSKIEGTPRERLLAAANELFYAEGVHTVGIDRVIERAGVAKASLYSTFGSKDELVRAYLEQRYVKRQARILDWIAKYEEPRDKILGLFELLGVVFAEPTFRGCAFMKASAEAPVGEKIRDVCDTYRAWLLDLFAQLARDAGADDPAELARHLLVLHDGATFGATMDGDVTRAADARTLAEALLNARTRAAKRRARR
ncbi:MAG TPA: TetR/AcrR family transcriptional regulator [Polyangiales bacterium]|nr:TetR/AcrR family transcriptional regulator [Polyangiales bacterium]